MIAVVTAASAVVGQQVLPTTLSAGGIASAVISGILYYAVAYSCYLTALREVRAPIAASAFYLIPVFGVAGAWLTGERLAGGQWLGAAIAVAAVALITTHTAEQPQPSSAAASTQMAATPSASSRR
jgi:drug/metabolite transporter (DMT)-like permease